MTKTNQNVFGCQVTGYTLLGYRHFGNGNTLESWLAIYEVETNEGTKFLGVKSDGWCQMSWYESKPEITQTTAPERFTPDPWTRHGKLK